MRILTLLAVLAALLLGACGQMRDKEPPPKPFVGTRWEVMLELPVAGEQPWIRVGDGRLEGFGGCNRINARYVQDSVGARALAFSLISASKRSCDPNTMSAEARVIEVLQSVSSYTVSGDLMAMSGSGGTLRLRAVSDVLAAGFDIANTRWVALGVQEWGTGNAPRMEFSGEGRITGYTGCNSLGGSYALIGDRLEVVAVTTKRACAGAGSDYEKRLLEVLADKPRLLLVGPRLTLTGASGVKVEFQAAPAR